MTSTVWPITIGPVPLATDEIHVWRIDLKSQAGPALTLSGVLSDMERCRAGRFKHEMHRRPWMVARVALRTVLAQYLGAAPASLRFLEAEYGKPALDPGTGLEFNLSHSGSMALIAVARERAVGIDVEQIRKDIDLGLLSRTAFSLHEQDVFARLPEALKTDGFFNCWCRKEAFMKAVGEGISFGLTRFDVTLAPGESARLLRVDRPGFRAQDWSLQTLDVGPDYKAAVAAWGSGWSLRRLELGDLFLMVGQWIDVDLLTRL